MTGDAERELFRTLSVFESNEDIKETKKIFLRMLSKLKILSLHVLKLEERHTKLITLPPLE